MALLSAKVGAQYAEIEKLEKSIGTVEIHTLDETGLYSVVCQGTTEHDGRGKLHALISKPDNSVAHVTSTSKVAIPENFILNKGKLMQVGIDKNGSAVAVPVE